MGLDGVELVMEVEDRFAVELPDDEVSRIRTVADLAAIVIARLPRGQNVCPTARMFYVIRRLLVADAGVRRNDVRPDSPLDKLIPSNRPRIWRQLRRQESKLPKLEVSERVDATLRGLAVLFIIAAVGAFAVVWYYYDVLLALLAPIGLLVLYAWCRNYVEFRFGSRWPQGVVNVGDLARVIAPFDATHGSPGQRLLVQMRVVEEVRRLTAEQLGLPLDKVKPESDFVKDLKID